LFAQKAFRWQFSHNLSFGFLRYEKRRDLEANFVHLFEGNSQVAIFENKCAKFDREIAFFRVEKPKTQVYKRGSVAEAYMSEGVSLPKGEYAIRIVGEDQYKLQKMSFPWKIVRLFRGDLFVGSHDLWRVQATINKLYSQAVQDKSESRKPPESLEELAKTLSDFTQVLEENPKEQETFSPEKVDLSQAKSILAQVNSAISCITQKAKPSTESVEETAERCIYEFVSSTSPIEKAKLKVLKETIPTGERKGQIVQRIKHSLLEPTKQALIEELKKKPRDEKKCAELIHSFSIYVDDFTRVFGDGWISPLDLPMEFIQGVFLEAVIHDEKALVSVLLSQWRTYDFDGLEEVLKVETSSQVALVLNAARMVSEAVKEKSFDIHPTVPGPSEEYLRKDKKMLDIVEGTIERVMGRAISFEVKDGLAASLLNLYQARHAVLTRQKLDPKQTLVEEARLLKGVSERVARLEKTEVKPQLARAWLTLYIAQYNLEKDHPPLLSHYIADQLAQNYPFTQEDMHIAIQDELRERGKSHDSKDLLELACEFPEDALKVLQEQKSVEDQEGLARSATAFCQTLIAKIDAESSETRWSDIALFGSLTQMLKSTFPFLSSIPGQVEREHHKKSSSLVSQEVRRKWEESPAGKSFKELQGFLGDQQYSEEALTERTALQGYTCEWGKKWADHCRAELCKRAAETDEGTADAILIQLQKEYIGMREFLPNARDVDLLSLGDVAKKLVQEGKSLEARRKEPAEMIEIFKPQATIKDSEALAEKQKLLMERMKGFMPGHSAVEEEARSKLQPLFLSKFGPEIGSLLIKYSMVWEENTKMKTFLADLKLYYPFFDGNALTECFEAYAVKVFEGILLLPIEQRFMYLNNFLQRGISRWNSREALGSLQVRDLFINGLKNVLPISEAAQEIVRAAISDQGVMLGNQGLIKRIEELSGTLTNIIKLIVSGVNEVSLKRQGMESLSDDEWEEVVDAAIEKLVYESTQRESTQSINKEKLKKEVVFQLACKNFRELETALATKPPPADWYLKMREAEHAFNACDETMRQDLIKKYSSSFKKFNDAFFRETTLTIFHRRPSKAILTSRLLGLPDQTDLNQWASQCASQAIRDTFGKLSAIKISEDEIQGEGDESDHGRLLRAYNFSQAFVRKYKAELLALGIPKEDAEIQREVDELMLGCCGEVSFLNVATFLSVMEGRIAIQEVDLSSLRPGFIQLRFSVDKEGRLVAEKVFLEQRKNPETDLTEYVQVTSNLRLSPGDEPIKWVENLKTEPYGVALGKEVEETAKNPPRPLEEVFEERKKALEGQVQSQEDREKIVREMEGYLISKGYVLFRVK
jgi:hypothetical protein